MSQNHPPSDVEIRKRFFRWYLKFPDHNMMMCTLPEVTEAQVRGRYPNAIEIKPGPDRED